MVIMPDDPPINFKTVTSQVLEKDQVAVIRGNDAIIFQLIYDPENAVYVCTVPTYILEGNSNVNT